MSELPTTPLRPSSPEPSDLPESPQHRPWLKLLLLGAIGVLVIAAFIVGLVTDPPETTRSQSKAKPSTTALTTTPDIRSDVIVTGRERIWDIAFLPAGEMLFTERKGVLNILAEGELQPIAIPDVMARGEGGLMGLAVDNEFSRNRYIYACYNGMAGDIRIARWQLSPALKLGTQTNIITGIPANTTVSPGRHSGCRLGFGPDNNLWIGTGDTARGDLSVQPQSLGGKVLRVTRDGKPVAGNLTGEFDPRIYSYGHRNVQGVAFFPAIKNGVAGLSTEHGAHRDDEVNELRSGNFGWAPPAEGYDESVPMTDTNRFPDAVRAIWSSGEPTQAPSGATIISGHSWQGWNGAIAIAMLKGQHLKILRLDGSNKVTQEEQVLQGTFGRLRAVTQGPDKALYLSTDNGTDDRIIRVVPRE